MKFVNKYRTQLIIALVIIALVLGVYFSGYLTGKSKNDLPEIKPYNPSAGAVDPAVIRPITDQLYDAIEGLFTMAFTKDKAAQAALALNDNELTALHNDWNDRYFYEWNQSLHQAMSSELNPGPVYWPLLKDRLSKLNLL